MRLECGLGSVLCGAYMLRGTLPFSKRPGPNFDRVVRLPADFYRKSFDFQLPLRKD